MKSILPGQAVLAAILSLGCIALRAQTPSLRDQAGSTPSEAGTVIVHSQPVAERFPAYGAVQPIAPLPVRTVESGVIAQLGVVPGSTVRAGEALATLTGPEIESLLVSREGAAQSAQTRLAAAKRSLHIERAQLSSQLSTRQAVAAAQSAVAAAKAAFTSAQAQLDLAKEMRTLRAPSAGRVLAVNVGEGEHVMAGQTVVTLQTHDSLWLTATYYGADASAVYVGMTGTFQPASGTAPVPVKVVGVSAALAPDGGETIGLAAKRPPAPWSNGERGTVSLSGPTRRLVAVPTRALILDQARWWVLVRTSKGDRPQGVVPGPRRGWETFIERGLSPGERIVVENAYLEFHRGITQQYTPPD